MITTSLEVALLVLTVEFGLLAAAITFFAYRGARTAEAEAAADASALVSKVSNTEDARRTALETVFKDKYQYEGDELSEAVDEFLQREKAFYNAVVGAFMGRGKNKIADLSDELTKVVAPWISITPKKMVDAETAESLAAEKSAVEAELGETKQVLEKMIAEYNRAFRIESSEQAGSDLPVSESIDDEMDEIGDIDDEMHEIEDVEEGVLNVDLGSDAVAERDTGPVDPAPPAEDALPAAANGETADAQAVDPGLTTAMIEELDDEPEADAATESPVDTADKPMTADDLDDLMQSLESEPLDDVETA